MWVVRCTTFEVDDVLVESTSDVARFKTEEMAERYKTSSQLAWLYDEYACTVAPDALPDGGSELWRLNAKREWRLRDVSRADEAIDAFLRGTGTIGTLEFVVTPCPAVSHMDAPVDETDWLEPESGDEEEEEDAVASIMDDDEEDESAPDDDEPYFNAEWHESGDAGTSVRRINGNGHPAEMRRGLALAPQLRLEWMRQMMMHGQHVRTPRIVHSKTQPGVWFGTLDDTHRTGYIFWHGTWQVACERPWKSYAPDEMRVSLELAADQFTSFVRIG